MYLNTSNIVIKWADITYLWLYIFWHILITYFWPLILLQTLSSTVQWVINLEKNWKWLLRMGSNWWLDKGGVNWKKNDFSRKKKKKRINFLRLIFMVPPRWIRIIIKRNFYKYFNVSFILLWYINIWKMPSYQLYYKFHIYQVCAKKLGQLILHDACR